MHREFPPAPPFPTLRQANEADLARIASLSVLGFRDSEMFRYMRPRYSEYPQDAVASFANLYRSQLCNPRAVVIVSEDWWSAAEVGSDPSQPTPAIPDQGLPGAAHPRAVVGVASWILPENSPRVGQFVPSDVGEPVAAPDRDLSVRRQALLNDVRLGGEQKFLADPIICDKLVVHPHYRRRGHATRMLRWGLCMAEWDGIDQGVVPSHMGEPLYRTLGFQLVGEIEVPGDCEVEAFKLRVLRYPVRCSEEEGTCAK